MEQERLDELTELRFRHQERMTSAMIESQQEMVRLLAENTKLLGEIAKRMDKIEGRMDKIEERVDRVQELLALALDDLAFIKNHLQRGD